MQAYLDEAVSLLKKLIAIPSISKEESKTADLLYNFLASKGFKVNRKGNNIWVVSHINNSYPTVLLNSHHDTVKPSPSWTKKPFVPVIEGNKLFGLGSNDAGASLVSQMQAFFQLVNLTDRKFNLIYSATAEEEITGLGGVISILPELGPIDLALVGEPTNMQMAVAEKGLMVLDCKAIGKSGHAARNEGINAIYKAMDDIAWFRTYTFPEESDLLGKVKTSVTLINAGSQHNVVPDECSFVVDVRTNEFYSNEQALEIIRGNMKHSEVTPRSLRHNSSYISLEHPLVKKGLAMGLPYYGSPTTSDQAVIRLTSMKIGPGDSARSHTADEYIMLDEIQNGIEVYVALLRDLEFEK